MRGEKTTDIILKMGAKAVDGLLELSACFTDHKGIFRGDYNTGIADRISLNAARKAAERLREKGCLEKIEKNGKVYYRITEQGRKGPDKFIFDRDVWDGEWRIVIFDIPEELRPLREMLRRMLKKSGFKQLQKSVWVSPFDVLSDIEQVANDHDLRGCIWFFVSKSIQNDDQIIKQFLKTK